MTELLFHINTWLNKLFNKQSNFWNQATDKSCAVSLNSYATTSPFCCRWCCVLPLCSVAFDLSVSEPPSRYPYGRCTAAFPFSSPFAPPPLSLLARHDCCWDQRLPLLVEMGKHWPCGKLRTTPKLQLFHQCRYWRGFFLLIWPREILRYPGKLQDLNTCEFSLLRRIGCNWQVNSKFVRGDGDGRRYKSLISWEERAKPQGKAFW